MQTFKLLVGNRMKQTKYKVGAERVKFPRILTIFLHTDTQNVSGKDQSVIHKCALTARSVHVLVVVCMCVSVDLAGPVGSAPEPVEQSLSHCIHAHRYLPAPAPDIARF